MLQLFVYNNFFTSFQGKAFADIYRLKAHLGSVHGGKTPDFRSHDCAQCDAKFQYNYLLRQHVQAIHEGIKFQCPECKLFSREKKLFFSKKKLITQKKY